MEKEKITDVYSLWYDIWMNQSKTFFDSAQKTMQEFFTQPIENTNDFQKQMNAWLDSMKQQWQLVQLSDEQKKYANYWQSMTKIFVESSELLSKEWVKRLHNKQPIKNVQELYELWLECCRETYKKALRNKEYQEAYGEYMNAAFKFWEKALQR